MSSKTVKDYQGDPIHENVRMFERELKQKFPQLRVTSGYRKKAFTKQGNVSQHAKGGAIDLGYDKEVAGYLANTYEGVGLLNKYGLGVLDESTKEVMDKTGATGAHLHVGMDSGLVAKAKERYKQLTPKENITPELTDFDFTTQTPTFALEDSNVEEEDAPKEDKSKEVAQAKEVLKEEQFMSDMFKGKITPIQLAQEEAPQQAPQSNLLESFANIESFVDTPLAQQGLTVPRKKMSLEELDAKMKQTRALLDKGKVQQSNLKERPKEVVRESTQTTFRNETGRQVNTNPNQQISTKHVNERRTESQIIADRKKAVEERQKADKDWLTNWYANRVIPNERLQELYLEDKDIYNERMKNVPTVTNVESIDNNPYITGRYNSENGQILMTPKSRDNVYLHEVTHYSDDFPSAMRTVHNQVVGLNKAPKELTQGIYNEKYDYFTDSDEVHARIQVLRKEAGITPEQNVTKEYLDKFLKDYKGDNENINDLLNIADPPHLLEMLNYMASNKDKTIKKGQLAQEGGYTEEEQRFITDYFQQEGQIPISSKGMYEFPNQKVVVPTNGSITMKNIPHKIKATSLETGETKILLPGLEYFFDKTQNVLEVPLKK